MPKSREENNAYHREYYKKTNRLQYYKDWYNKNLEKNRNVRREYNNRIRIELLELFGKKCCVCGFDDWRALQIDHINGNGNVERVSFGHSSSSLYKKIKEDITRYQLLCANCNWIKRYENRELFKKI